MPDKITRLSSMTTGAYCTLIINGKVSYRRAKKSNGQSYITNNKTRIFEKDLPLGEEVTVK